MLYLLQMGPSKVLTTFPLQIQNSWQLSLLELPSPYCVPACNTVTSFTVTCIATFHCNTVASPSDSSGLYTSTVLLGPLLLMQHSRTTLAFKTLITLLPILSLLPLLPHHRLLLLAVLLRLLLPPAP